MTINDQIAVIFSNIGNMLEVLGENPFKIRAYKNAAKTVGILDYDLETLARNDSLTDIQGIGKDLAAKITEYVNTGKIEYYENLREKVPEELIALRNIQGIGPKLLQTLYSDFKVRNINDLEKILSDKDFINSRGVGTKKINELKVGIKLFKFYLDKVNLGFALPAAETLIKEIGNIGSVKCVDLSGDLRRGKETVDRIDLIVNSKNDVNISGYISKLPFISNFSAEKNYMDFTLNTCIPVGIKITNDENFNRLKFISTGSREHVDRINSLYKKNGMDIFKEKFNNEKEIYEKISLEYIPPELREDHGEIESAEKSEIPALIKLSDIRGDLHIHSTWSDGNSTIKEMAETAKKLGYEYIAVTDHSISSRIANGLDVKRLNEKNIELNKVNTKTNGIEILSGAEVDIKPDGSLDYPDDILRELDIVIASVHSSFKMEEDKMTDRIICALRNPYVCALGHPTGRLIGERSPYKLNIKAVIETAAMSGKALELNSSYMRLDLKDEHVKMAIERGVKLIISTDAHHTDQLIQMRYGIITARRGWATRENVINAMSLKKLREWLGNFK